MRDSLNTSNGMPRSGSTGNGSVDLEPPPTPLQGRTVSVYTTSDVNSHFKKLITTFLFLDPEFVGEHCVL